MMEATDDVMQGIPQLETPQAVNDAPLESLAGSVPRASESPAEECNRTFAISDLLRKHEWTLSHESGGNVYWTRPGKKSGPSASVKDDLFYVFTNSDPHFVSGRAYNAFQVFARLEHGGDESAAAKEIVRRRPKKPSTAVEKSEPAAPTEPAEPSAPWPEIKNAASILAEPPARPAELIEGICFELSKIFMFGPSKSMKTFFQIFLAVCIATGADWFGRKVRRGRVLYINLELREYSFYARMRDIMRTLGVDDVSLLDVWTLRGHGVTIEQLRSRLPVMLAGRQYSLIVVDPLYKVLGKRSENDASEMADLLNHLEIIAHKAGASILVAHHHAKGLASAKNAIDRGSGSGVTGRDGDCIIDLSPHETEDCLTMEVIVRDMPPTPKTVLRWAYPCFEVDHTLNPNALKQSINKKPDVTVDDVLEVVTETPQTKEQIILALVRKKDRGIVACKTAFRMAEAQGVLKIECLKRSGTNALKRYHK